MLKKKAKKGYITVFAFSLLSIQIKIYLYEWKMTKLPKGMVFINSLHFTRNNFPTIKAFLLTGYVFF